MMSHRTGFGLFTGLLALALGMGIVAPALAQQTGATAQGPTIDKRLGEEEEIRLRHEWFFSTRRAGATSDAELSKLRYAGVLETRQAVEAQRLRRAEGYESSQNVWVEMGPSPSTFGGWAFGTVSGRIQAIASDWQGTLYAGATAGGVWKSTNDGQSWTSIFDSAGSLTVGAIAVDPLDPDVLWVGTGDNIVGCESYFGIGLLRSVDGGQTWETRNGTLPNTLQDLSSFASIAIDPRDSDRIVTGGKLRNCSAGNGIDGGLFTTVDGGENWTARLSNMEIHEIARDPISPDTLWAGTEFGVYKSVDNGESWTLQTGLPSGNVGRTEIAVAPSDPDTVYALYSNSRQMWRTTNGGTSWSMQNSDACDGQCWYNMVIRVHRTDRDVVYRGTIRIWKSQNGGVSWSNLTNTWGSTQQVHQDTHSLLMHPTEPATFYVGTDGGLWKSSNGGSSFQNVNGNMNVTQFYAIDVDRNDPGRICGGAQDNSSLARNGNNIWDRQAVTGDGFVCAINSINPSIAYITSYPSGGYPNVWRAQNGLFGNFSDITGPGSGVAGGDRVNWVTPYILDPVDPSIVYLGTHRVYRSDNGGGSWTQVGPSDLTGGSGSLLALEVNRGFPEVVYSGSESGWVYRSDNGGVDFIEIGGGLPANRAVTDIGADPTNPDRAFATVGGFNTAHVWEWNNGAGWTAHETGLPNVPANTVLMLTATDILVGTDVGVFRSYDGGQQFVPFMDGLPEGLVISDLKYVPQQNLVTIGTYARGAWQMTVDPLQPIVLADSVVQPLVEEDGDGDDEIEPGETWSVRPVLRNVGGQSALDVSAVLSTATPGVTILDPATGIYGDLDPGATAIVQTAHRFTVAPEFVCGSEIAFDLTQVVSSNPPESHADQTEFLTVLVQDGNEPPVTSTLVEENFDPQPADGWSHEVAYPGLPGCFLVFYKDSWNLASKDAEHGMSYHCGNGPGNQYATATFSWLHPSGKDSEDGPGIEIPTDAIGAMMTVVHWYDTADGQDGGQVLLDGIENDQDAYTKLTPVGGYPGTLGVGDCNGLEGEDAFQGASGGWVTSQFDLLQYKGHKIYPAFVFGSDTEPNPAGEGWYIDEVKVEYQTPGAAQCDIAPWPGEVSTAAFRLVDPATIEASWNDSCNLADFPGQAYSIQSGDLDTLHATGSYTHMPLDDLCDRVSASSFTPGAGNEYYLIVPAGEGREGGAGVDSTGADRPQTSTVCGERRVACP